MNPDNLKSVMILNEFSSLLAAATLILVMVVLLLMMFALFSINGKAKRLTLLTSQLNWLRECGRLHAEIWADERTAKVLNWITDDALYSEVEAILLTTIKEGRNKLDEKSHNILHLIDRFCSLLDQWERLRLIGVDHQVSPPLPILLPRKRLLSPLIVDAFTYSQLLEREALAQYIVKFWPNIRPVSEVVIRRDERRVIAAFFHAITQRIIRKSASGV